MAELRDLIRVLLDESGLIKPSVLQLADQTSPPTITVSPLDLADGKAPSEFRIFKRGENPSTKGTFVFDDQSAESVMAIWAQRQIDLMMDYEHMSLVKPPIIAPASCKRFIPQVRDGELWATQCTWTPRATAMMEDGEYRFFSPAFDFDIKTGRVLRLINVALTNNPALDAITPLVQASERATATTAQDPTPEESPMKMKCSTSTCTREMSLKAKGDDHMEPDGDEAYCASCKASAVLSGTGTKVMAALGLASDVGESAALQAVNGIASQRTEIATLTGQSSPAAQLGVISGWKQKAEDSDKLRARVAELETATLSQELGVMLDDAGRDGRLPPSEREMLQKRAVDKDGKPSLEGIKFCREYLTMRSPSVTPGEVSQPVAGIALTEDEAKIARILGQDLAEAAKDKARSMGARVDGK